MPCPAPALRRPFRPPQQQQQSGGSTRSEGNLGSREQPGTGGWKGDDTHDMGHTADGCPRARTGEPGAAPHLLRRGAEVMPGCRLRGSRSRGEAVPTGAGREKRGAKVWPMGRAVLGNDAPGGEKCPDWHWRG